MKSSAIVLTIVSLFSTQAVIAAGLIRNGGFDISSAPNQAEGWSLPPEYRISDNEGMNGARGLVWERNESRRSTFARQEIRIRSGKRYRFSGQIRIDRKLTGEKSADGVPACACLIMTFSDKDGKYLGENYTRRVSDTQGEWVRVSGETKRLEDNVARVSISPFVWHQAVGKVVFDDIQVEEIAEDPVISLFSDVYRDTAWEGEVTFTAVLNLDRAAKLSDYRLCLAYSDGQLASVREEVRDFTHTQAKVTLPVAKLPKGRLPVTLEVRSSKADAILGRASVVFNRTAGVPARKCWIDRHNRLIVDGKPFFPLACYTYNIDEARLDAFCRGAFNTVLPYPYLGRKDFDRIEARGLKVIATLKDCFYGASHAPAKYLSEEDADRSLLSRMEALKDHPAVIAWYLNDECSISEFPRLVRQYGLVRDRDDQHPAYSVLYQYDQIRDYKPTCDVIGTDPYPIGDKPIALAADWTRATRSGFLGGPVWQVPQAFAWKWWDRGDDVTGRVPSRAEFRSMCWQMIANGANGICAYCFGTLYDRMKREEFEPVWAGYCEVSKEIAAYIPVFLAVEPAPSVKGFSAGMSGRCWRHEGRTYLLVVNETREPVSATLELSEPFGSVKAVVGAEEAKATCADGRLKLELAPLGVAMFEVES